MEFSARIAAELADRLNRGADAAQIASAVVSTVQQIDVAIAPVIGRRGVAALYDRSLNLAGLAARELGGSSRGDKPEMNFEALSSMLAKLSSADAAAQGGALIGNLHSVLADLVGLSLTQQLLRNVRLKP